MKLKNQSSLDQAAANSVGSDRDYQVGAAVVNLGAMNVLELQELAKDRALKSQNSNEITKSLNRVFVLWLVLHSQIRYNEIVLS